jgi:hypothetical protein
MYLPMNETYGFLLRSEVMPKVICVTPHCSNY